MRFTDYTYEELRDVTPDISAVFVPLGCIEQQGPHMAVNFDSLMITRLCDDISTRLDKSYGVQTLMLPTLPFGPTPEHAGFGHGYVNLQQSTHEAIVEDILDSLAAQGFSRLVLWRGCGQHELGRVVDDFNHTHEHTQAYQPVIDYGRIANEVLGPVPGGHADSFATSICLVLDSAAVREDQIQLPHNEPIDWTQPVDFAASSDTGVIGDPTKASRDAGKQLWSRCVEAGAQAVLDILSNAPVQEDWHFKRR